MPGPGFDLDRIRLEAAQRLPAECFDDFQRLAKTLVHGPDFQWLLADAPDERVRARVLDALDDVLQLAHLTTSRFTLDRQVEGVPELEEKLVQHARLGRVVHVLVTANWFDGEGRRWDALNARRERLAADAKARLLFWLNDELIQAAARFAPDLWAWRAGIYAFRTAVEPTELGTDEHLAPTPTGLDTRSMAERHRRIAEIRAWLASHPSPPDDLLVPVLHELGGLLYSVGDYDAALAHWREVALPVFERLGDVGERAITMGKIADILRDRGQLDEALRIRKEEELPVYERLGDVHSRAVTLGKIAEIFQARGQLDEALRIMKEELLPVFDQLGDVRERAVCQAKIAIGLRMLSHRSTQQDAEIASLLRAAYADTRRMQLPEADQIRALADELGLQLEA